MRLSLLDIADKFLNDIVEEQRFREKLWPNGVTCLHCNSDKISDRRKRDSLAFRFIDRRKDFTSKSNKIIYRYETVTK